RAPASPSWCTSRAGRPSPASQPTAPSPRTIAAVLAVFASTQLAAATLTVRQQDCAGSPVAGVMMWCSRAVPRRQLRTAVPEVARPPVQISTAGPAQPPAPAALAGAEPPAGPDAPAGRGAQPPDA